MADALDFPAGWSFFVLPVTRLGWTLTGVTREFICGSAGMPGPDGASSSKLVSRRVNGTVAGVELKH